MDFNKSAKKKNHQTWLIGSATAQITVMSMDHCEFGKNSVTRFDPLQPGTH